ncbi:histidine phosphatase family protein [Solitalea koreensis]|uniref:Probable phosphoglycerate mutase n=1 Tax=Solitalea koreensis TaxID=543615 RepID=A0A521BC74_9SPHI|nr:histidine phosphatase family protein [Solitalea koreensis]SMO44571.1 probable phosphoglycerate mutase [Solitalea koreensis]
MKEILGDHPAFMDTEHSSPRNYKKVLYILRHGETDYNQKGIVQGRGVNTDLNDTGRQQAQKFFEAHKHIHFDKIYTSTLKRTHQTVAYFLDKGIAWEQHSGLDELDWGENEGRPNSPDVQNSFHSITGMWTEGNYEVRFPGGESPLDVSERQREALQHILSKEDEQHVLVCMHGRAMRILLCQLTNLELRNMDSFIHQNTSLYKLGFDGERFELLAFNSIDHLEDL